MSNPNNRLIIYTDGSCIRTDGGWAFFAMNYRKKNWLVSGCERDTTNNRMEMSAVLHALSFVTSKYVEVRTDSKYVIGGCTIWRESWKKRGYKNILNMDLWREIWEKMKDRDVIFTWVAGHTGEIYNEKVDVASREEALSLEYLQN